MLEPEVYDSLLDVPFDDIAMDGNDAIVPGDEGAVYEAAEARMLGLPSPINLRLVVPFRGTIKKGTVGDHVIGAKRALAHADCYPWLPNRGKKFTRTAGDTFVKAVRKFTQLAPGIDEQSVLDRAAWNKLGRWFDPYSIEHLLDPPLSADDKLRNAFLAQLMYLYNRRWAVRYSQARPLDLRKPPTGEDCSGSGEYAAKWAGFKLSLSGYTSFAYGNTDTQLARFRMKGWLRDTIRQAKIGDPKYYGSGWDPSHVAYFIGVRDGISRVWSNGHYPIGIYAHDYRHDGIVVCNLTGR